MQTFFSFFVLLLCLTPNLSFVSAANPFYLENPPEEALSDEGALALQEELRTLSVTDLLTTIFPKEGIWATFNDFHNRTSVGMQAKLVADAPLSNGKRTEKIFEKIGEGGDRCVVTYATYNQDYAKTVRRMLKGLKKTGFNGYFFAFLGGYPNPTGEELHYAATPYGFKIFLMKEAEKLGFTHILWIDCRCVPKKNISPIFEQIEKKGSFFMGGSDAWREERYLLPFTRQSIQEILALEPLKARKIGGGFIGLKMDLPIIKSFVEMYYDLVKEGTPFLSCYPEEFVISTILEYLGRDNFVFSLDIPLFHKLLHGNKSLVKQDGYFFYHAPRSY